MAEISFEPWEPEETIGKLWHAVASRFDAPEDHAQAAVDLSEISGRLSVFFRALGGAGSVEIKPVAAERSTHRLSFLRRLGTSEERVAQASFDGESLRLPARMALFSDRAANGALYLWLTALAAQAQPVTLETLTQASACPMARDLARITQAERLIARALVEAPGLRGLYLELCDLCLQTRPRLALPAAEAAVEARILRSLGETSAPPAPPNRAPQGYRPFRPVPLWLDLRAMVFSAQGAVESAVGAAEESTQPEERTLRARRHRADLAERRDSLILHKFEAILSWTEFLNLNRRVEDDEAENAKKASADQDEIGLGQISKAPATRLKLHLDLAPEDAARERLSGRFLYPEWEARSGRYLPDHACVLTSRAEICADLAPADPARARRIRAVRRQFEALRPARILSAGHLDGDELDLDATLRAAADLRATGSAQERVWRQTRPQGRSLAVSILLDMSRSTESAVTGRQVIDIAREALSALAWGLEACGDDFAINAFSSLKRDRVFLLGCKDFGEPMSANVEARLNGLKPAFYTRLGAAIRHAAHGLAEQAQKRRLLLVLTDGKPNDLDHYEGRHGVEDSRMAVLEARRAGQAVFGVTIDAQSKAVFGRIFGQGGFAVIPHADRLPAALPQIYRKVTGQ